MSSRANPDRPNRLVMALGIATIVLFSVNLLSMLSQRVWPKLQNLEFFGQQEQVQTAPHADATVQIYRGHFDGDAKYSFVTQMKKRKRCYKRRHFHSSTASGESLDRSLEQDLNRLEREIEREMDRLNLEMSDATSKLEDAITLELSVDAPNSVHIRRHNIDVSELENEVDALTKKFEVRVRELEKASRAPAGTGTSN